MTLRSKSHSYSLLSSSDSMSTANWCLDFLSLSSPFFLRQARSKCPCLPQKLHVASLAGHLSRDEHLHCTRHRVSFLLTSCCPVLIYEAYTAFSWTHSFVISWLGLAHMRHQHGYHWSLLTFSWWLPRLHIFA